MIAAVLIALVICGVFCIGAVIATFAPHVGETWLPEARPEPVRRGGRR